MKYFFVITAFLLSANVTLACDGAGLSTAQVVREFEQTNSLHCRFLTNERNGPNGAVPVSVYNCTPNYRDNHNRFIIRLAQISYFGGSCRSQPGMAIWDYTSYTE